MVTTTSVTNSTAAASSTTTTNSSGSVDENSNTVSDYDKFLLLLTTQMKNQDPTNPMDPSEQMSQLAQFSSVEQAVKTNDKLDTLITAMAGDKLQGASSYLGKNVSYSLNSLYWDGSKEPSFQYQTNANAKYALATVSNASGVVVRTFQVPLSSLTSGTATWDGKTDGGLMATNGTYNISVQNIISTTDDTQNTAISLTGTGKVTSVEQQSDGSFALKLENGVTKLNASDIQRLSV